MNKIIYTFTILSILFFLQNCEKKEESSAPIISLVSITPTTVAEFTDSIIIIVHYIDNDGDIGIPDADKNSLWIQDARLENPDEYFISPLAPLNTEVAIEGEFRIKLKNTFKLGTAAQETTSFKIWIIDRNLAKSNVIETPKITITN